MKPDLALSLVVFSLATLGAEVASAQPRSKQRPVSTDKVTVTPDANAPRAPAEQIKKTQINELKDNPAKKEIKALEDQIYTLEKPSATLWRFHDDARGAQARDVGYVAGQIEKLDAALAAVRAANSTWAKLGDYDQRVAYLKRAAAAQKAHYGSLDTAKADAVATGEREAATAWAAKRVTDEGQLHDLHKKSVGKILFATTEIAEGDPKAAVLAKVAADSPLFARGYFAESPWNTLHTAGIDCGSAPSSLEAFTLFTRYQVNGEGTFEFGGMKRDKATFQTKTSSALSKHGSFTVGGAFATKDDEGMGTFRWITSVVPKLREGDNKVKLEIFAWCYRSKPGGTLIASGEITVTATKASLAAVAKRATFKMSPSVHTKAQLTGLHAKMTRHYEGRGYELIDFRTASEWQPVRHEVSGAILHRAAEAVAVFRKKGTVECQLASIVLQEPYDGKTYGPALNFGGVVDRPFVCHPK